MKVSIKAYGNLRYYLRHQGGKTALEVEESVSVRDVLDRVGIPVAEAWRISIGGQLVPIEYLLKDGDEVNVFAAVGGGSGF